MKHRATTILPVFCSLLLSLLMLPGVARAGEFGATPAASPALAATDDPTSLVPAVALAAIGVALVVVALAFRRRNK
jgi:hypothetical protein